MIHQKPGRMKNLLHSRAPGMELETAGEGHFKNYLLTQLSIIGFGKLHDLGVFPQKFYSFVSSD